VGFKFREMHFELTRRDFECGFGESGVFWRGLGSRLGCWGFVMGFVMSLVWLELSLGSHGISNMCFICFRSCSNVMILGGFLSKYCIYISVMIYDLCPLNWLFPRYLLKWFRFHILRAEHPPFN